jgi:hypothetical protein
MTPTLYLVLSVGVALLVAIQWASRPPSLGPKLLDKRRR